MNRDHFILLVLAVIAVPEMIKAREKQEAAIRALKAGEMRAKANVDLATANIKAAEAIQDQAEADVHKSDAQLTADNAEFNRVQDLVASKAIAARLLDEARKKYEASQAGKKAAQAALKSAKANVSVATAKLAVADADRKAAQAQIEVSEKELEEMDVMMEYATLKASMLEVQDQKVDAVRVASSSSKSLAEAMKETESPSLKVAPSVGKEIVTIGGFKPTGAFTVTVIDA